MASPSKNPEVVALRTEVAELRDQVTALVQELHRAQQHIDLTMRSQLRCRACGCRRIAHAVSVLDRGDGDMRKQMALYQGSWWSGKTVGKLEVYSCTRCGHAEWWVKDPGELTEHDDFMRILDGDAEPDKAPYR